MPKIAGLALALAFACLPNPAQADGSYGTYSGRGYNEAWLVLPGRPNPTYPESRLGPPIRTLAPLGTAANPAPVCYPAVVYRVDRTVIYNAPPAATDTYRIVPSCQ